MLAPKRSSRSRTACVRPALERRGRERFALHGYHAPLDRSIHAPSRRRCPRVRSCRRNRAGAASAGEDDPFPEDTVYVEASGATPEITVALSLSRATFGDGSVDTVLIGRDDVFADSLASGVAQSQGPLLLVPSAGPVPDEVMAEIARLGASVAWVFGGEAAVGPAVVEQLEQAGLSVERLAGAGRVETAVAVARRVVPDSGTALIAREGGPPDNPTSGFADALAGGGWAAQTGWPVLLTNTAALSASTAAYLEGAVVDNVVILGGVAAVSAAVEQSLRDLGLAVERVSGAGRAETAVAIAEAQGFATSKDAVGVVVVEGFEENAWAAGFAAAAISARGSSGLASTFAGAGGGLPIVLADGEALPIETQEWLVRGPEVLVCAVPRGAAGAGPPTRVCERARMELGFPPALSDGSEAPDAELLPVTAWADEVVAFTLGTGFTADALAEHDPVRALGPADCSESDENPTCGVDQTEPRGFISLGNGGMLEVRFTDNLVFGDGDAETAELFVYEAGPVDEAVRLTIIPADGGAEVDLFDLEGSGACGSDAEATSDAAYTVEEMSRAWTSTVGSHAPGWTPGRCSTRVIITDVAPDNSATNRPTAGADLDAGYRLPVAEPERPPRFTITQVPHCSSSSNPPTSGTWVFGNNGTENRLKRAGWLISHDAEVGEPVDGTHMHAKDVRDLLDGLTFGPEAKRQLALLDIQLLGATKPHAASLRAFPSRVGPLTDQLPLKLGHAREHGQNELPAM